MELPIWISHRGLSQQHDENSAEAFQLACDAGFTWLETDLHSTKDNHIVLSHDSELYRASSGSGNIAQKTRKELEKVQLPRGGNYLFLDEFLTEFNKQRWVFDIKPDTAAQTIKILCELFINDRTLLDKIIFLFWNNRMQNRFLKICPDAICFSNEAQCYQAGLTTLCGFSMLGNIKQNKIYSLLPRKFGIPLINKRIVQSFHKRGAQVIGYLPANSGEVQLCLDAGVDFILSNDPPVSGL